MTNFTKPLGGQLGIHRTAVRLVELLIQEFNVAREMCHLGTYFQKVNPLIINVLIIVSINTEKVNGYYTRFRDCLHLEGGRPEKQKGTLQLWGPQGSDRNGIIAGRMFSDLQLSRYCVTASNFGRPDGQLHFFAG